MTKTIKAVAGSALLLLFGISAIVSQELPTVRYHEYGKIILHLPNWVMVEKGYCKKHGIKCEPVTLSNAPLAQAAAAADSVHIVNSTIDTCLQAIAKGNDLQIIGSYWSGNPYLLVARTAMERPNKTAGYPKNLADFKGKKIGVASRGSSTEIFMKALLKSAGMAPDSVIYVPVGGPVTAFAALAAGQIDAALTWDPVPAFCQATKSCEAVVDLRKAEGPENLKGLHSTSVFLQARREFVSKHQELVDAFNRALAEAVAWIQDPKNYDEVLAITKKHVALGETIPNRELVYKLMLEDSLPRFNTKLYRPAVKAWQDFLIEYEVLSKPLNVEKIIYKNAP